MPELVPPTPRVRDSYVTAIGEYQAAGSHRKPRYDAVLAGGFDAHLEQLALDATEWSARRRRADVPQTTLWWVDGARFLGEIRVRHRLTDELRRAGGHIGYDLRPSARGQGHGGPMLAAALPVAAGLGIECALLTVEAANTPSRRMIEKAGGLLWQTEDGRLRYWLPTC
ncbi:GNAT family N-acetyltransferase [Catellatospora aurea]|uniref:GNAT family N-acetyltransferase n=1 Tax=Catellatospora aurea TaxID=1337874 RepID=A0ABW2H178_9ACTN